ncbi:MAG: Transcriptional regulator, HxlR family [uncultured Truepera sp.]|uniref:Transcriptional regulator, HxlR family n=1 Tax=uncultured Truepera sp. TaxID=543023 RepID=A0A6J4VYA3_9DEIN|nr:MAG: Transcriptional regulator, HxlR family [uncultured Truepera sp.]
MLQTCLLGNQRDLIDQVLDKWSLSILAALYDRPQRFNELRREIPDITQKSLAQTLKRLERNGMIDRTVLDTQPFAVEYRLTGLGRSFEGPLGVLTQWATDSTEDVHRARTRYDALQRLKAESRTGDLPPEVESDQS